MDMYFTWIRGSTKRLVIAPIIIGVSAMMLGGWLPNVFNPYAKISMFANLLPWLTWGRVFAVLLILLAFWLRNHNKGM